MKLTINNGVLEKCILDGNESRVELPETVEEIGPDAFAGNPVGKIRQLFLPDSLKRLHPYAFNGLDQLDEITAYTYDEDEEQISRALINGQWEFEMLNIPKIRHLIILKGKRGDTFYLDQWAGFDLVNLNSESLERTVQYPENIYIFAGADLHCGIHDDYGETPENPCTKTLTVYFSRDLGNQEAYSDSHTANLIGAEKIQFINTELRGYRENSEWMEMSFPPILSNLSRTSMRTAAFRAKRDYHEYSWQWNPITPEKNALGIEVLYHTDHVILPEGLTSLCNEFLECMAINKVIIPSSVTSIKNSFINCPSLNVIAVDAEADANLRLEGNSFMDCPRLKRIQLYTEDPVTGVRRIIKEIRKNDWLRYHLIDSLLQDIQTRYSDIRFYMDDKKDESRKAYEDRRQEISDYEAKYPKINEWWNIVTDNGNAIDDIYSEEMMHLSVEKHSDEIIYDMDQEDFIQLLYAYHDVKRRNIRLEKQYQGIGKINPYLITDYDLRLMVQEWIIYEMEHRLETDTCRNDKEKEILSICYPLIQVFRRTKDFR